MFFSRNRLYTHGQIERKNIKDAIFHSPYLPLPAAIDQNQNLKKIITIYDLIPVLFPEFFTDDQVASFKEILRSIKKDTRVICISESTKTDLCNYLSFLNPDNVSVTHLAASSLFYKEASQKRIDSVKAAYGIPVHQPYILNLSTLEPRKNTAFTIEAFARLVSRYRINDLNLVLVGTQGWKYESIFDALSKYPELANRVIITGYVADENLAAIYSGALAFVYPSKYEGFGLPPLEAMQCGTPVITSNNSSLPEVVGGAGILVDIKSMDELINSLYKIYADSGFRNELSVKALDRAKKFNWSACTEKTVKIYKGFF